METSQITIPLLCMHLNWAKRWGRTNSVCNCEIIRMLVTEQNYKNVNNRHG